jgi:tetraacyldisaccharide 4'-kinase
VKREAYFKELINGKRTGAADRALLLVLRLCSHLYALAMTLRAAAFSSGLLRSQRLPKPVVSVGNLTVGGTGKTPMTAWIAAYLLKRGKRVAVLTRGYGGTLEGQVAVVADGRQRLLSPEEAGDEPCLLADQLPELIVVMGSNRYAAGLMAMEKFSPDIFILDDGFQHLRLQRDLDILLLDAAKPLGNGYALPAGLLRETVAAAARADLVVFTRCGKEQHPAMKIPPGIPLCRAYHALSGCRPADGGAVCPFSELAPLLGLAFAGIGDPEAFFDSLEAAGLRLAATLSFPDHTAYGEAEVAALARLRRTSRADYLITTAKDAVKLGSCGDSVPFYIADLDMAFHDGLPLTTELDKLL